jgi:two-component system sensor histidine kinase TctE
MVYHELRSPLALVATMARSAAAECEDDRLRMQCLSIVRTTERMLRMAGHLMVVAERSRDETQALFDPIEVARRVAADYRAIGANVVLSEAGHVPALVSGSAPALEALLCSLMGNALDHSMDGALVSLSVVTSDGACEITIVNQPAPGTRHRGLGLGAYIAEKLASELGGTLRSEVADGTFRATVALPAKTVWLEAVG